MLLQMSSSSNKRIISRETWPWRLIEPIILLKCQGVGPAGLCSTKTYVCGLISSIVPYIIDHAGEEVEAGRDVMREQQDAQSLRRNTQINGGVQEGRTQR